jgi:hypothetical protein
MWSSEYPKKNACAARKKNQDFVHFAARALALRATFQPDSQF